VCGFSCVMLMSIVQNLTLVCCFDFISIYKAVLTHSCYVMQLNCITLISAVFPVKILPPPPLKQPILIVIKRAAQVMQLSLVKIKHSAPFLQYTRQYLF
jgi:hypothetical protein